MKHLAAAVFILCVLFATGQERKTNIKTKFELADSILIASHETTSVPVIDEKTGKLKEGSKLVVNAKPNHLIIHKTVKLDRNSIDSLLEMLTTSNKDSVIEDIGCFIPHHGILIFKKGKVSYFDICFGCRHFSTSKDLKTDRHHLSNETWINLERFFKNRNITFEMPVNEESSN